MSDDTDDRARRLVDDLSRVPLPPGRTVRRIAARRRRARIIAVSGVVVAVVGGGSAWAATAGSGQHRSVQVVTTAPPPTTSPPNTSPPNTSPPSTSRPITPTITSPAITSPTTISPTITSPTITSPTIISPTITSPTTTETCAAMAATRTFLDITSARADADGSLTLTVHPARIVCGGPDDLHYDVAATVRSATVLPGASIEMLSLVNGITVEHVAVDRFPAALADSNDLRIFSVTGPLGAITGLEEEYHP